MSFKFVSITLPALLILGILGFSAATMPATASITETRSEVPMGLLIKRPETPHGAPIGSQAPA